MLAKNLNRSICMYTLPMLISQLPTTSDAISSSVKQVLSQIENNMESRWLLIGFGRNMQWVARILRNSGIDFEIADWRKEFHGFDCCDKRVIALDLAALQDVDRLAVCADTVVEVEDGVLHLIEEKLTQKPIHIGVDTTLSNLGRRFPYQGILSKSSRRAQSMISDEQLVDLIQVISQTSTLNSPVAEFGTLYGGTAAVWAEALLVYGKRQLWLFDSFSGIPQATNGLDDRWTGAFAGTSLAAVRRAFSDLDFVNIVDGDILANVDRIPPVLSVAYIASDTFATGRLLLDECWARIEQGGILVVCDYRSYPNCVPLTVEVDRFFSRRSDAFLYRPAQLGFLAVKK